MKIKEYKIERSQHTSSLAEYVNDAIKEGWQPIGGVSYCERTDDYIQAMVMYE